GARAARLVARPGCTRGGSARRLSRAPRLGRRRSRLWMGRVASSSPRAPSARTPTTMWGSPGTMLAARAAGLDAEYEQSAAILVEQWDAALDGIWAGVLYGRAAQY